MIHNGSPKLVDMQDVLPNSRNIGILILVL